MKKNFTFSAILTLMTFISFAQCPTYFKRNNGNGTCGGASQIQLFFAVCPGTPAAIDSIFANGTKANLIISSPDASKCASKGYVSYCLTGNLPPAGSLKIYFNHGGGIVTVCTVPEGGVTPVVLTNFEIQRKDANTVAATWETEQELNSSRFEIERSTDNITFETIGTVSSKNSNSNTRQYYSFADNSNNQKGVSLYRIKMIDKDNTFTFSSTKTVKGSMGKSDFVIFPNPSTGNAKITISDFNEPTNIMILDNSGRLIKQATITNSNSFEINNLQRGNYIIKTIGEKSGEGSVKKLSVIN